jgi:hypothetical protein
VPQKNVPLKRTLDVSEDARESFCFSRAEFRLTLLRRGSVVRGVEPQKSVHDAQQDRAGFRWETGRRRGFAFRRTDKHGLDEFYDQ